MVLMPWPASCPCPLPVPLTQDRTQWTWMGTSADSKLPCMGSYLRDDVIGELRWNGDVWEWNTVYGRPWLHGRVAYLGHHDAACPSRVCGSRHGWMVGGMVLAEWLSSMVVGFGAAYLMFAYCALSVLLASIQDALV